MILINKIKRLNYKNILIKIFNEIKNPRNRLIFRFINSIFSIYNFLFECDRNGDRSLLIWDVRVNSITFDFLSVIFYTFNIPYSVICYIIVNIIIINYFIQYI